MLGKVDMIIVLERCCSLVLLIKLHRKPVTEMLILWTDEFQDATSVVSATGFFWPAPV